MVQGVNVDTDKHIENKENCSKSLNRRFSVAPMMDWK